ncbi:MAG TPA: nuclear transport factor 2 family protein, partial [Pyrinomonadaceae bacterium]
MSPEVVGKAIKEYFAAIRAMDKAAWLNTFAENAISHDPVDAPPINGHDKLSEFFETITAAFKNVGLTEDDVFIAGKFAAVKWTGRGT